MDSILSAIVPDDAVTAEVFGDINPAQVFPEEEASVRHAVNHRQREFRAGRWLARQALQRLGYPLTPILSGPNREPIWPDGVIGSITHCSGYCGVALGRTDAFLAIGVDAEPNDPLPEGVLSLIGTADERAWLDSQIADGTCWDRLLFSAKESVFKGWFPLKREWLDFSALRVRFQAHPQTFRAELLPGPRCINGKEVREFHGRYLLCRGLVLTAVVISA